MPQFILLLIFSLFIHNATAQQPILQIDTGGHKALIWDITFTPDGKYLVSASDDKTIRVWDWQAGKTDRIIRGQIGEGDEGKIFAMAPSPDGRWLAVGGWMGTFTGVKPGNEEDAHKIRLYHFPTGQLKGLLKGHRNVVLSLAFSPNSRYLVSGQGGSYDQIAIILEVETQQHLHTLRGHTDDIYAVAFTPDNQRVVTGSYDHDLRLWQVNTGKQLAMLSGHRDKVYAIAISPTDGTIASGSWDDTIRLWDGNIGQFIKQLANQGTHIGSLSFSPNGRWAATGGGNNQEIHIWDIKTGKTRQRLQGVGASTWAVGFTDQWLAWGNTPDYSSPNPIVSRGSLEHQFHLTAPNQTISKPQVINRSLTFNRAQTQWKQWSLQRQKYGNYVYSNAMLDF